MITADHPRKRTPPKKNAELDSISRGRLQAFANAFFEAIPTQKEFHLDTLVVDGGSGPLEVEEIGLGNLNL